MRKYIVRKNHDEKNIDPLNAPERTVFFQKTRTNVENTATIEHSKDNPEEIKSNVPKIIEKQEIKSNEKDEISDTIAKKLFNESFSAIDEFQNKKLEKAYQQLEEEKKLSYELNEKLHQNLTKIANVEVDLVKKQNQLQKQLDQKTEELIESERLSAIGEFSTRLAHDMRNPLSIIRMSLENFKALYGVNEDKQKQYDRIEHAMNRMTHQVDGVLEYVQKTPLKTKKESLSKIIKKSLSPMHFHTNITLFPPENDVIYDCDQIKMEIVFGNLLLNSIQAIGTDKGKIIIKIHDTPNTIKIMIHDSGKGVSNEFIPKMFDPLFTTKQDGTGLGLPSVKNVIEQHGGTINFSNNPTTFTLTLPKK